MIKNERQYRITRAQAEKFDAALQQLQSQECPGDLHPRLWQAQIDATRSQYEDLLRELADYTRLREERPAVIEVANLEELPRALIQARIALDLTQKQLAERTGLKEQQLQRYEATEYVGATLARINEIAGALGVRVAEHIFLPQKTPSRRALLERLDAAGITSDLLLNLVLPLDLAGAMEASDGDHGTIELGRCVDVIERVFGWRREEVLGVKELVVSPAAMAAARFKIPANAQGRRLSAFIAYAHYLAMVVANACADLPSVPLTSNPRIVRKALLKRDPELGLRAVLDSLWDAGIPVLPLDYSGAFHGACWRVAGRNVIVAKQKSAFDSRWIFDLLHEYRHALQEPDNASFSWLEETDLTSVRRVSPEEQVANAFAGDVILDGRAEDLVQVCVDRAGGSVERLKRVVQQVASENRVRVDHLANYLAYRLSLQRIDWWGAASNLQTIIEKPYMVARDVFFERFPFDRVNEIDVQLLERALTPQQGV